MTLLPSAERRRQSSYFGKNWPKFFQLEIELLDVGIRILRVRYSADCEISYTPNWKISHSKRCFFCELHHLKAKVKAHKYSPF